ncbi:MAG: hypothetical protein HRU40_10460 [Saprospiraceae bacterium]|nr:hypothetical protein [Saprospiraceae bacterium]
MKKISITVLIVFASFFCVVGQSCYLNWHWCYEDAQAEYASDISYCKGRGMGIKYFQCFNLAKADFSDATEACSESYYRCIIQ